jgi:UDP-glucose 4-epimerase
LKIFVTGGAGFIGSVLTKSLLENGHSITIYDSLVNSSENNAKKLQKLNANFICGDIIDLEHLSQSISGHDICIHLAGQTDVLNSIKNPDQNNLVNITGTKNLLDACVKHNVDVIAASSAAVYEDSNEILSETSSSKPNSPYGKSKLIMEQLLIDTSELSEINCQSLRMFNVYGKDQNIKYAGVITKFLENIKNENDLIIFGDGTSSRDFVSVYDVTDSIILAIHKIKGKKGEICNIASGTSTKIIELAEMMIAITGKNSISIKYSPSKTGEIINSQADISRARDTLGYSPKISLREGLEQLINS